MKKNRLLIIISVIVAISSTILTFILIPNNKKIIKDNTIFNTQERTLVGEQTPEEGERVKETLVPIEEVVEPNEENIKTITKSEKVKETNKKPTTNKTDNKSDSNEVNNNKSEDIKLETPTLQVGHGSKDIEMYLGFTIAIEGYYSKEETLNEISGWELYEKINEKYNLVGTNQKYSIDVTIDVGETKTYVARTFVLNKEGEKVYSAYSNEVEESNKIETPTLQVGHGSKDIEMYLGFTIAIEGYYSKEETLNEISGWELYEKINDKYNLVGTAEKYSIDVTINVGETKTYVARTFVLNKEGEKVYSAYSNEVEESNKIETPTLQVGHGSKDIEMYLGFTIAIEGYYSKEETLNEISGWELYEKTNDKYNLVGTAEKYSIDVTIDVGETKTYVARTFILNKEGEKVYSEYSNEYIAINK